ncbi:3'5'-cyclic nucleotide phosphodiesterase [Penicillium lagena]|uniref:3'5'-cyclic nucleotide phosphodiesterase n=1 Tax=Penicillium lagena TaxID=94218 RepID=UPI0025420827|nr:3'5'-cyclic nucleotide phosphodiesterase [Penicillium lagena]KAJ5601089.1 3'5'-cyclic nucleotide phosphodiesterase [Penicillium lagena]
MGDPVECPGVYIDDRVRSERWVRRNSTDASMAPVASSFPEEEPASLQKDVEALLHVCKQIYLCNVGSSFAGKLAELSDDTGDDCTPIFAFFDVDFGSDEINLARRKVSRASWTDTAPPSPGSIHRTFTFSSSDEAHGLSLLSGVSTDIQSQDYPNLVVPIAILRTAGSDASGDLAPVEESQGRSSFLTVEHKQIARCLDAGAVDVLTTPLDRVRIQGLVVHAYRTRRAARKEMSRFLARKKLRKYSWVGVHDEQPYAYLREAMVSKLMRGICNPEETIEEFQDRELNIDPSRKSIIKERVGSWKFSAHDFSEDELVFGACEMLQHALTMPGLEQWWLSPDELRSFLLACRAAYNSFVLYHNFRHAIDVLQCLFCFLLHIGALPPYEPIGQAAVPKSAIASLLSPFDSLTLLISAIGHDVGHPGVNNFFLVKLNAPLAQLYNDNSVLEAFHCAAFSQILRRQWPSAFKDKQLRKLLISSILATDMGVHQKFMERMGSLQEKFHENGKSVDGWKPQDIDMYKTLLCGLLIKCADISNVARPWKIAEKWTQILQEEFANQGEMEKEVGMETALFGGPPELGNIYKLATGQIGFMSIFAMPLFEGVSDLMPQLQFTVDHIGRNKAQWQQLSNTELRLPMDDQAEITVSPRSHSPPAESSEDHDEERTPVGSIADAADTFRSPRSSTSIALHSIEPVVSPDTPGPQIEITGTPMVPDVSSRKSSSAMPDLTYFSIPESSQQRHGSDGTQYHTPLTDVNRSSGDPAVLAAVLYANSATRNTTGDDQAAESAADRPSSSRHGLSSSASRHHAHHSSTGRASAPTGSNRNSCTRTQSISTYSNNMTPISPSTNATSYLAVDSGDESRISGDNSYQSDPGAPCDSSTRPSTSDAYTGEHSNSCSPDRSLGTSHSLNENGSGKEYARTAVNGARSPTQSTTTGESMKHKGPPGDDSRDGLRRLPKKRSRLRLAFWRRRNHHQQEVRGGS